MEELIVNINGKEYKVKIEETESGKIKVHHGGEVYEVQAKQDIQQGLMDAESKKAGAAGKGAVLAPLPGTVSEVKVKKGDKVNEGQPLVKLIAMKMENEIRSKADGTVKEVMVKAKDVVEKDSVLLVIE